MKVTLPSDYKDTYTLTQLAQARNVIACMKDDCMTVKEYAGMAAREALKNKNDYAVEVLKATAETALNKWIECDRMGDGTGCFDVWIDFIAETGHGFIRGGAYLTDIWQIGAADITDDMFIRYYTEK